MGDLRMKLVSTRSGSVRLAKWVSHDFETVLPDEVKVQTLHFSTGFWAEPVVCRYRAEYPSVVFTAHH